MTTSSSSVALTPREAGALFVSPDSFADDVLIHDACRVLRRESPIHRVDEPDFDRFWLLTKHADVHDVSRNSQSFHNAPRPMLLNHEAQRRQELDGAFVRTLIHMDEPDHRLYRGLTADWFLPKSLAQLDDRLADLARRSVDRMAELGGSCDFARDIAMPYPLQVILAILGLPEADYARMLTLTQELFGGTDNELRRHDDAPTITDTLRAVVGDFFAYFTDIVEQRKARPTGDLASVIANATIDGRPLDPMESLSYYVIIATAGHDTTSSAMAGGMQALIENPDQLTRLRDAPSLVATAADEMIRWTTPVRHFMRTAVAPVDVGGHRFEQGDWLMLSYLSANRDEDVFDEPYRFDVGRTPNKHLAFGFGAHYCLGAMLARMELKALFSEIIARVDDLELAGRPELSAAVFVGGLKHLPICYHVR